MTAQVEQYYAGSGELKSDLFKSSRRRTMAICRNKLHILKFANWPDDVQTYHQCFDLGKLFKPDTRDGHSSRPVIDAEALTDPKCWQSYAFKDAIGEKPALATNGEGLWAFYRPRRNEMGTPTRSLCALRFNDAGWSDQIKMSEEDGETRIDSIRAVAAQAFGETQFFVAAVGRVEVKDRIFFGLYDTRDIDTHTNRWKARSGVWRNIQSDITYYLPGYGGDPIAGHDLVDTGNDIDLSLFYSVEGSGLSFAAAIVFAPIDRARNGKASPVQAILRLPVDAESGRILDEPWKSEPLSALYVHYDPHDGPAEGWMSSLERDPAGRLRGFYPWPANFGSDYAGSLVPFLMNTAEMPAPTTSFGMKYTAEAPVIAAADPGNVPPSACFYVAEPAVATTKENDVITRDYPILEFITYGADKLRLIQYGTMRSIRDWKEPDAGGKNRIIVAGYIDGPIPVPLANFKGQEISAGRHEAGVFVFNTAVGAESETRLKQDWTRGFESEGSFSKGIGPAYKLAFTWGNGSVASDTIETELENETKVVAEVESSAAHDWLNPEMRGRGYLVATRARFYITGYQFFDAAGAVINDAFASSSSVGPKLVNTLVTMRDAEPRGYSFQPYAATPGNIESYTPEGLNKRMAELGYTESDDYFSDVVCRNAFVFGDTPYLAYDWDENDTSSASFHKSTGKFREQNWTFDSEGGAGLSGGGGFELFGLGLEFEAKFLAGGGYSEDRSKADGSSSEWGIELEAGWGPLLPPEDAGDAVGAYSFRAYFLPVPDKQLSGLDPTFWTDEFRKYGDPELAARIDAPSGCWRIVFVVTRIKYADGRPEYLYHDTGVTSVYHGQ